MVLGDTTLEDAVLSVGYTTSTAVSVGIATVGVYGIQLSDKMTDIPLQPSYAYAVGVLTLLLAAMTTEFDKSSFGGLSGLEKIFVLGPISVLTVIEFVGEVREVVLGADSLGLGVLVFASIGYLIVINNGVSG